MQFGGLCRLHNVNTRDREVLINMKLKNVCNSRHSLNEAKHFAVKFCLGLDKVKKFTDSPSCNALSKLGLEG